MDRRICEYSLGRLEYQTSNLPAAIKCYEVAQRIYKEVGYPKLQAIALISRGRLLDNSANQAEGLNLIDQGISLFLEVVDDEDRALPGWKALFRALTIKDVVDAEPDFKMARSHWLSINRKDLVYDWL